MLCAMGKMKFSKTKVATRFCCFALLMMMILLDHRQTVVMAWLNPGGVRVLLRDIRLSRNSLYAFDKMKILENRLSKIDHSAPDTLSGFYDKNLASFAVQPGAVRLSVTSTCFAIQAILASSRTYADKVEFDLNCKRSVPLSTLDDAKIPLREIVDALLRADWRDEDLFQVPLIIDTVLGLDQELNSCELEALDKPTASKVSTVQPCLDSKLKNDSLHPSKIYV